MFWNRKKHVNIDSPEVKRSYDMMNKEIEKVGGSLHFLFTSDKDGWFAQCKEFSGIITGGSNPQPSKDEIMDSIIDSVKTAFHIPTSVEIRKESVIRTLATKTIEERELEVCV